MTEEDIMVELYNVYCKHQLSPAVVGDRKPCFGWKLRSDRHGSYQKSYRILLYHDQTLLWDSCVVETTETSNIPYNGPILLEAEEYHWRVCVTMRDEDTAWSEDQLIRTGLDH